MAIVDIDVCPHCGHDKLDWKIEAHTNAQVSNGRYNNHDFFVQIYSGCDACGETLTVIPHVETYESERITKAIRDLADAINSISQG